MPERVDRQVDAYRVAAHLRLRQRQFDRFRLELAERPAQHVPAPRFLERFFNGTRADQLADYARLEEQVLVAFQRMELRRAAHVRMVDVPADHAVAVHRRREVVRAVPHPQDRIGHSAAIIEGGEPLPERPLLDPRRRGARGSSRPSRRRTTRCPTADSPVPWLFPPGCRLARPVAAD